jgi:AraC-like DNA-binding protein
VGADELTEHPSSTGDQTPIPGFQFSTEPIEVKEQFDGYRDFMTPLSDIEPLAASSGGFRSDARVYDLGAFQLASMYNDPAAFSYTKKHMRQFGMEHWSLNLVTKGNIQYASGNGLKGTAGDMYLHSYTSPFSGTAQNLGILHLMLNRDDFYDVADALDGMIDQNLAGPISSILRDFVLSIGNHAHRLTMAELPAVNEAFTHLLKAAFRPNAESLEAASLPIAASQFAMVRRIIDENLKSPYLTPDMICSRVGISRRKLYYIFEPHGGVMKYISQRRLAACYNALAALTVKKPISSIAYEYGFTNLSSFYRQFQARYGFRPGEARSARLNGHTLRKTTGGTFADWLSRAEEA